MPCNGIGDTTIPRNGAGLYALPGTYEATAGETILAAQHNDPLEDLEQDANNARPIVAGGTGATSASAARTALAIPGTGTVNLFSEMQKWSMGAAIDDDDVDGSNILTLPTDGNAFLFSGTQQVDAIATIGGAGPIYLVHTSARTLTHHVTNLILPGGGDIDTEAGDISVWVEYATGDWRCVSYTRATASPTGLIADDTVDASGTAIDRVNIPAWVQRISINFAGVRTNGTSAVIIQLGDSGGVETSGYTGALTILQSGSLSTATTSPAGFSLPGGLSTVQRSGRVVLEFVKPSTNVWSIFGAVGDHVNTLNGVITGFKSLSGALDRIRITTVGGSDAFNAGSVRVILE